MLLRYFQWKSGVVITCTIFGIVQIQFPTKTSMGISFPEVLVSFAKTEILYITFYPGNLSYRRFGNIEEILNYSEKSHKNPPKLNSYKSRRLGSHEMWNLSLLPTSFIRHHLDYHLNTFTSFTPHHNMDK